VPGTVFDKAPFGRFHTKAQSNTKGTKKKKEKRKEKKLRQEDALSLPL